MSLGSLLASLRRQFDLRATLPTSARSNETVRSHELRSALLRVFPALAPSHGRVVSDALIHRVALLNGACAKREVSGRCGVTITTAPDDWSYAMQIAFAKRSGTVAPAETVVIQIVLRVERGVIEIAGVDEGTSGFTTATQMLASDPFAKTLTVRIDDKERTWGLIIRNASGNDCSARFTVYGLSAYALEDNVAQISGVTETDATRRSALILVHTLGKTASQSLEASLKTSCPAMRVRRDHFLNTDNIKRLSQLSRRGDDIGKSWAFQATHAAASAAYIKLYAEEGRPIYVLTGFRDPFSRLASSIMEVLGLYIGFDPSVTSPLLPQLALLLTEFCRQMMLDPAYFSHPEMPLLRGEDWWQKEMLGVHGLQAAPALWRREGLLWCADTGDRTVMLYRMEDAPRSLDQAVQRLSGDPTLSCRRDNAGEGKPYAQLYEILLRTLRFPRNVIDSVLDWDYVRLLYTAEERNQMRSRWAE